MNDQAILEAIGDISSRYIVSAQNRLGLMPQTGARRKRRRPFALLVAAVILLLSSLTVAMAASPELREAFFTFFQIGETETIPDKPEQTEGTAEKTELPKVDNTATIGGVIKSTYVTAHVACNARNGLFYVVTDEYVMNTGNHTDAYREENGQFVKLEKRYFCQDYTVLGADIHVEFEWVEHEGMCRMTYVDPIVSFRSFNNPGPVEATLFTFTCPAAGAEDWMDITEYPVLINLETGELTDVLAGTGAESLEIKMSAISGDLTWMLLACQDDSFYIADLAAKKLHNIAELSGEPIDGCSLIGDTLACWVLEGESVETAALGSYRAWVIDLNTLERRDTFTAQATAETSHDVWSETYHIYDEARTVWEEHYGYELPPLNEAGLVYISGFDGRNHGGAMYAGSPFALEVDENRGVWVIDLSSGEKSVIPGFIWPEGDYPNVECVASPNGWKVLIQVRGADSYYTSVGILDFENRSYTQFGRENLSQVNEQTIYWFDNDRVIIGTSSQEDSRGYYLYEVVQ